MSESIFEYALKMRVRDLAESLAKREEEVSLLRQGPPQLGYIYSYRHESKWYILMTIFDDGTCFMVPMWDLDVYRNKYPEQYEIHEPALIPFTLKGWGNPVAHFNQAKIVNMRVLSRLRLVDYLEDWKHKQVYRQWRSMFPTQTKPQEIP